MRIAALSVMMPAALVALGLGLAAERANGAAVSIVEDEAPRSATLKTDAERMFADAPMGVDPMVTGPRSDAFRQQQKLAGCETAVWPNIPAACYPG